MKRYKVVWRADDEVTTVARRRFFLLAWLAMRRHQAMGPLTRFEKYGYWGVLDSKAS